MFRISNDTPAYYLTSVTNNRLPVFRKPYLKEVACDALGEARRSGGFLLFAYVVMPDHIHTIVGSEDTPSEVTRFINGITGRRVIDYLKDNSYEASLAKLSHEDLGRRHRHSLWDHHPNVKRLNNEDVFMQKVNYLHQNPVRAGLVGHALAYRWSSARCWARTPREDEPLTVDMNKINWSKKKVGKITQKSQRRRTARRRL